MIVEDDGVGFDNEQLEPWNGPGPRPGFGLGLATVERICARCGWRLELENRAVDEAGARACMGARATIHLTPPASEGEQHAR